MSLRVMLALEVLGMNDEDGRLLQISRIDTAVNPNPNDAAGEIRLAEKLVDLLLQNVGHEARGRFRELKSLLEKMEEP